MIRTSSARTAALALHRPAWGLSALYAAAITAATALVVWPGFMSYDSLFAYEEGRFGIQTMLWPPLHAYMFTLAERAGVGPGAVLVVQIFLLFFSAAVVLSTFFRDRRLAAVLCILFGAAFLYITPLLGSLVAQWRDVPTASFALLALALWLQAARLKSRLLLVGAALALGVSVGLRYNAFALVFAMIGLMLWSPWLGRPAKALDRLVLTAALVLSLGTAWASTQWRLPDLVRLPRPDSFGGTQQFDVIGVSACAGRNYIPAGATSSPLTIAQIRRIYDPRHLQQTTRRRPGVPLVYETNAGGAYARVWRELVVKETRCYIAHRSLVAVEQMGMARSGTFYPIHSGLDPNTYDLKFAQPKLAEALRLYVERGAVSLLRRPFLLYLGAVLGVAVVAAARRPGRLLLLALLAGVGAYPALLFVAAPAADARYIFPSNIFALLIILTAVGMLLQSRRGASRD